MKIIPEDIIKYTNCRLEFEKAKDKIYERIGEILELIHLLRGYSLNDWWITEDEKDTIANIATPNICYSCSKSSHGWFKSLRVGVYSLGDCFPREWLFLTAEEIKDMIYGQLPLPEGRGL